MEESILTFEKQYKNSWLGNDDCLKKVCRSVIKGRGRRTSPGRCLTIHYLNQRHACLPSLCATCKYSGRCSTRVDERTGGVCTRLWRRRWWRDVVHPANSIPFLSLSVGCVTRRKFVDDDRISADCAIKKILAAFAALFIQPPSPTPLCATLSRRSELSPRNLREFAESGG